VSQAPSDYTLLAIWIQYSSEIHTESVHMHSPDASCDFSKNVTLSYA